MQSKDRSETVVIKWPNYWFQSNPNLKFWSNSNSINQTSIAIQNQIQTENQLDSNNNKHLWKSCNMLKLNYNKQTNTNGIVNWNRYRRLDEFEKWKLTLTSQLNREVNPTQPVFETGQTHLFGCLIQCISWCLFQ